MKRLLACAPWVALLAFALVEVSAHAWTRQRVPSLADWRAAAAFVRGELRARDLITAAPAWSDPVLRQVLGDRIDLAMAGRSDTAGYERLWALSIRGARPPEAPSRPPVLERSFGGVRVLQWDLGKSSVRYDFVRELHAAQVSWLGKNRGGGCELRARPPSRGGGLGRGVFMPSLRFGCEPGMRDGWVAPIVMEDLSLSPRYCVYHPAGRRDRIQVAFADVPLGDRLQLYAGLYYEHERMREGGPITLHVRIGGAEAARLVHRDGDGWKAMTVPTRGGRGAVAFEVAAPERGRRHFCWAASTREGGAR